MATPPKSAVGIDFATATRVEFLTWLLTEQLLPAIELDVEPDSIAWIQKVKEARAVQKELVTLRQAEGESRPRWEDLPVDAQADMVRGQFRAWPEQLLMLAIEELRRRHGERITVTIEGQQP